MRKFLPVLLVVFLVGMVLSGCNVTVDSPPRYGDVKVCLEDDPWIFKDIYGYVYIDDDRYGYVDSWEGILCTDWIQLELDEPHRLEVWDPVGGTTYDPVWFTPTYNRYIHPIYY